MYKESLRVLSLCSLRKICQRRDVITFYECLARGEREDATRRFSEVHSNRARENRHKLEHGKFRLDSRNPFLNMTVIWYCNSGPPLYS